MNVYVFLKCPKMYKANLTTMYTWQKLTKCPGTVATTAVVKNNDLA